MAGSAERCKEPFSQATAHAPLLAAQLEQESGWDCRAVSPIGAEGIAQLLPGTWAAYGFDANKNGFNSPFDPPDAIVAMGIYMCVLHRQVMNVPGDPMRNALWAYTAGPEATKNASRRACSAPGCPTAGGPRGGRQPADRGGRELREPHPQ